MDLALRTLITPSPPQGEGWVEGKCRKNSCIVVHAFIPTFPGEERSKRHRHFTFAPRNRNALKITLAELRLIASAAIMGDSSQPVKGYSNPAAIGMPSAL